MAIEPNAAAERELQEFLDSIPQPQSYESVKEGLQAEQASMSRAEIAAAMSAKSEATFDPETAVPEEHKWVDRGLVMSCEGANHASHRHFKVKARR